jgi:hypothetical protein
LKNPERSVGGSLDVSKRLSKKLLSRIMQNPKIKGHITEQAVRNAISNLRSENSGVTLNAAGYLFAKKKGFKVFKQLDDEDKRSLQFAKPAQQTAPRTGGQRGGIKSKKIRPTYGGIFVEAANVNGNTYPYIYVLENSLRQTILDAFKAEKGWWTNTTFVDGKIQEYADRIQKAESKYPWVQRRGGHPIYYVGLYELYKIITKNWKRFQSVFEDQGNLRTWFNELVPVRNLIAHNVPTAVEERKNVQIRTKFICTLIERKVSK